MSFFPVLVIALVLLSIPLADLCYFGRKRRQYERACNAMYWKLDPDKVDIVFSELGL